MSTGLELRSLITKSGQLELSLAKVAIPEPGPEQVVVKVEASPINPSDLGLLTGPADYRNEPRKPRDSSGLVEQQRWFMKARSNA